MAMKWYEAWGTWDKLGNNLEVAMVGSPSATSKGLPLAQAKQAGFGHGVGFEAKNDAGTQVQVELSLVGCSLKGGAWSRQNNVGYTSPGGGNLAPGYDYGWYVEIWYSSDGGRTYRDLLRNIRVATHSTPQSLAYSTDPRRKPWQQATIKWSKLLTLPETFTHLKFEIRGDNPAERHQNIYTREQVIPITDIKPWAIRKSNVFKSLDRDSGWFKIRKSSFWVDKSKHPEDQINQANSGVARIRKGNVWKGQGKIGGN